MNYRIILIVLLPMLSVSQVKGQSQEAQQLLLNVEKLTQFKQILGDMKKGYELVSTGYNSVRDLTQGNFSLHKTFLDGLMQVSPTVKKYKRVADIVNYQLILVREYKYAFNQFKNGGRFTPVEVNYTAEVYDRLFKQSLENLDDLLTVVTAGKLRMSDNERLEEIDRIYLEMQDKLQFLRHFNNETSVLAFQRAEQLKDAKRIKESYGIEP